MMIPECKNPKVPKPDFEFRHRIDIQVRFNDIDLLGHINNGAYFAYFDLGKTRYMSEAADARVEIGGIAAAIVNLNCNFYSPGYFEEPIGVLTSVTSISEHSFVMEQRIVNTATGDVKCAARSILAGFDPVRAVGIPIPDDFAAAVESFEGRPLRKPKQ